MVIGEEPDAPGFFWLAGQGGTGIQTSPAAGALVASLLTGTPLSPELADVDRDRYSPARFR
jgi:D-arginine dehydrogenase